MTDLNIGIIGAGNIWKTYFEMSPLFHGIRIAASRWPLSRVGTILSASRANFRAAGLADMARAIRGGGDFRGDQSRALHVIEVMTAILNAGEAGEWITLTTTRIRPQALPPRRRRHCCATMFRRLLMAGRNRFQPPSVDPARLLRGLAAAHSGSGRDMGMILR